MKKTIDLEKWMREKREPKRKQTQHPICRHYRLAADKKGDIIVLADLNMTSRETIRKILEEGGEVVVRRKETSRICSMKPQEI